MYYTGSSSIKGAFVEVKTVKKIFVFLTLLFLGEQFVGQSLNFEYLAVKDGLPESTVRTIIKDKYGFMWFVFEKK